MKFRRWAAALIATALATVMGAATAQTARSADYIVAVVNSEPITNAEVNAGVRRATEILRQQQRAVPGAAELRQQVLESLINERAQLQTAVQLGVRVDDAAIDQAEAALAAQAQTDIAGLRKRMASDGVDTATFRSQLREQLLVTRLREREVESRVRVSEQELDRYMQEQLSGNTDPYSQDINLAQVLVALPEKASAEQAAQLYAQAQKIRTRALSGESFTALVNELSAADRSNGGQLGLRRADRYPVSFVEATKSLAIGGVSEVIRSGAGFHVIKVIERKAPTVLVRTVAQTRVRHILLRGEASQQPAALVRRLAELRQSIMSGALSFEDAARKVSQDASAQQGGDLGWASPGLFVPEFEEMMNRLAEGQISPPTVSRFGVHLIQVTDRRRAELAPRDVRELMRNQLRSEKIEQAYAAWARDIRQNAFVDLRDPPN